MRLTAKAVKSATGDFHPCLVNRSGRIVWQGTAYGSRLDALAAAESERGARIIRACLARYVPARSRC